MWETHISETFVERNCNQLRHFALLSSCWPRIVRIVDQMWYIRTSPFCSGTSWNKPRSKPLMDLLNRAESFACSESSQKKVMRRFWELWELVWLFPCSFHVHWFIYSKNGSINQHTGHGWTSLSPADGSSD